MKTILLSLLLVVPAAQAHRPQPGAEELLIDNPEISWVVAGTFDDGSELFRITLEYDQPFSLPFQMLVPLADADHRPAFAVVGPGLPPLTAGEASQLPADLDDGDGAFVEWGDGEREVYFETVMRRTMYSSPTIALHLPQAATYEIWVWSPEGTTGDYQMGFGVEEDFSDGAWGPIFQNWDDFAW